MTIALLLSKIAARLYQGALAAIIGAALLSTVAHAATITNFTQITAPGTVTSSTVLGPQTVQLGLATQYTSAFAIVLNVTNANLSSQTVVNLILGGSQGLPSGNSICNTSVFTDKLIVSCTPPANSFISNVTMSGLLYSNVTALNTGGAAISLGGSVQNQALSFVFDTIASADVITSTAQSNVVHQGAVYSTAQAAAQSYLRFYNGGTSAGTVTVTLADYTTGQAVAQWTSPSIAPGAAPQFGIATIEAAATQSFTKPTYYTAIFQAQFAGTFQHVLYRPSDGVLSNLSTCDSGVTAPAKRVTNVHSSILETAGFPSLIVVTNTGNTAASANLVVTDARNGSALGTYPTATIQPNAELVLPVSAIETGIHVVPTSTMYHYVVSLQGTFTGYLQHRVNNQQAAIVTDMSTICAFASQ